MSFRRIILLIAVLAAPAAGRVAIGTFATWAAFCDEPKKCFAISQPVERERRPFIAVLIAGRDRIVRVRVGRPVRQARLRAGDATYNLTPAGEDAVADAQTSRRIVAALREASSLTVIGVSASGGRFRHHYEVAGAPSAIDAAAIAAAR